ncbi:transposase [Agriterribacter sp.]|uniref:transposase n=1 Tax=Agriterribacter sp. TaxID=2821509 RepID=UPI002CFF5B2E|nr:transposase [Agriterribacter sp.]HRP57656.1 transposase [Agriterribacter sp.]
MKRIKALLKKPRSLAKKIKIDICFGDECHFQQHGSRCKMWVSPEDKDPVVKHAPTRKSISLFGAVYATTGKMVSMVTTIFNAETFLSFLKKLLRSKTRGRKLLVVLDNAKYHHAVMLKPWLETNKAKIELLFLPP